MTAQLWIAFGFLALLVLFLMYSVIRPPKDASHPTVKFLTALCAGFAGGFFTGEALISINGIAGSTKFAISGTAGMALFFTIWFFYPKVFSHTVAHESDSKKLAMTQELDAIRSEILHTRINNNLYPALNKLRKFFIVHPELFKIEVNSAFYQKWLDDSMVEMGNSMSSSKWTIQTRSNLATDLETIHC